MSDHSFTKRGTVSGTLTIILANITSSELMKTALLAAVGAVVSFAVSVLLKWVMRKWKKDERA